LGGQSVQASIRISEYNENEIIVEMGDMIRELKFLQN
jgi:hypothetical protein